MKRVLLSILLFSALFPVSACAQWYLFPGARADSTRMGTDEFILMENARRDVDPFATSFPTNVALILPFGAAETPNANFLDFYSGALMAANSLSTSENKIILRVYDSLDKMPAPGEIQEADIIIGPVSYDDMLRILPSTQGRGKWVVSPLDPNVAQLSDRYNVIQAPSGQEAQADELVRWISDDLRETDSVVLLQSAEEASTEAAYRIAGALASAGVPYDVLSTPDDYDGLNPCRFILASDNDTYCSDAVKQVALMNLRGADCAIYSTARIRAIPGLAAESIHAAAGHITASYYADPSDKAVSAFNEEFRSIFKGECGQWVYQGYDLMYYFCSTLRNVPASEWADTLSTSPWSGLQTDFRFDIYGKRNTAARRLLYDRDNTIKLIH